MHTVAVGDQRNDLEMLHWAARGVAMGNAPDEVKAVADEVTGSRRRGRPRARAALPAADSLSATAGRRARRPSPGRPASRAASRCSPAARGCRSGRAGSACAPTTARAAVGGGEVEVEEERAAGGRRRPGAKSQTRRRIATFWLRSVPKASRPSAVPRCHEERSSDLPKSLRNQPIGAPVGVEHVVRRAEVDRCWRALKENTGCGARLVGVEGDLLLEGHPLLLGDRDQRALGAGLVHGADLVAVDHHGDLLAQGEALGRHRQCHARALCPTPRPGRSVTCWGRHG